MKLTGKNRNTVGNKDHSRTRGAAQQKPLITTAALLKAKHTDKREREREGIFQLNKSRDCCGVFKNSHSRVVLSG